MSRHVHDADAVRVEVWRQRFDALVRERISTPFAWGTHDCCLWAADCVRVVSGSDPAAAWRGTYSTEAEALALLDSLGGLEAVGALAGEELAEPLRATVGDVGLVRGGAGVETLGVCQGSGWLVPTAKGLGFLSLGAARRAWSVNHG